MDSSNIESVKRIFINFYNSDEIADAKKILWEGRESTLGQISQRFNTGNRSAAKANMDDIFDAAKKLDAADKLPEVLAKDLDRLPDRQPEELNYIMLVQRVHKLEQSREDIQETCSGLAANIMKLEDGYRELSKESSKRSHKNNEVTNDHTSDPVAERIENQQQ